MARFHTLQVKDIQRETADCVSIAMDIPTTLASEFQYKQGQYLTFKVKVNGEELRRSYSLCSSPLTDNELRVAVKKVAGGRVSTWMNDVLKEGDALEVMMPMGNFYSDMNAANAKHYQLFAGGSGITPMFSIIKTVLKSEPNSRITLYYANRDEASTIFKSQLDALQSSNSNRLSIHYIYDNAPTGHAALYCGMMDVSKVTALIENHGDLTGNCEYFICGPGPMMENVKNVLSQLKIDSKKVHIEYFTAVEEAVKKAEAASSDGKVISKVTIIMDGQELNIDLSSDGPTILDVAIENDLDAPFACKGAVCCTCRAKVLEGQMSMDANYALSEEEIEQGYVLTCQAHPATERVVVSYDEP
ncbi:MAG: FAD-binding oxidoreductase [Bacteroidetes bacterium]|nr:FAD-binding oxidoreductase [Bacteroidota bacterium]